MIEFTAWYCTGLLGSAILFRIFRSINKDEPDFTWCPSPIAIIVGLIVAMGGAFILIVSIAVSIIIYISDSNFKNTWLGRPICKKRDR